MDGLQIFTYNGNKVRTVQKDGEPWWVLKDVCEILGLGSPHKVFERLDEDEKGRNLIPTLGGGQEMTVINESGLYNVILRSDKPEAKPFRKWVTSEVLPAIRKTGGYITRETSEQIRLEAQKARADAMLLNAKNRAFRTIMSAVEKKNLSPIAVQVFGLKGIEGVFGVDTGDYLPQVEKTYTATEIGKMFDISAHKVGMIANANGLKTEEYGIKVLDKSRYSPKEVPSFRYNQKAVEKFRGILKGD